MTTLRIERLSDTATTPTYAHPDDAGLDIATDRDVSIRAHEVTMVSTGIAVAVPEGHVGLLAPRSGLAAKLGVTLVNAVGVIDCGYRGEVVVPLTKVTAGAPVPLGAGVRVAQLLVVPVAQVDTEVVDELDATGRGADGFGSTGA